MTDNAPTLLDTIIVDPPAPRPGRLRKHVKQILNAKSLFSSLRDAQHHGRHGLRKPGLPPGIDVQQPHPELEALFKTEATIRVVDFSATRYEFHDLSRFTLAEFLRSPRPAWAKTRWIDVRGLNYQVIGCVADFFKLHPLAVEDVFHFPQAIKADWYENHIYISMMLCSLDEVENIQANADLGREQAPQDTFRTPLFRNRVQFKVFPKMPPRPDINIEQINIFLMRDGTMISIFQNDGETATLPLYTRLEEEGTLLRNAEDASFLLFSLMDIATDHFFPILDAYKNQLDLLEAYVLQEPKAEATQELHLIAKELGILRRTLMPMKNLVASLRENGKAFYTHQEPAPLAPFISKLTRTYLADVKDHVGTVVDGLECFENDARHLIDLIFNTVSHSTNEAMRTLSLVSLVFLPISFLAGVFGMNFEHFPELQWGMGVYAFWLIVAGMVCVMILSFRYMGWVGAGSRRS